MNNKEARFSIVTPGWIAKADNQPNTSVSRG